MRSPCCHSRIFWFLPALLWLWMGLPWVGCCGFDLAYGLTIASASSLKPVVEKLTPLFESQYPQVKIKNTFAGSQVIFQQIRMGAKIDIFMTADPQLLVKLGSKMKLLSRQTLGHNGLVVVAHQAKQIPAQDITQVAWQNLGRVAICHPSAPCGRYTQEFLNKMPQIQIPQVVYSDSAHANLAKVLNKQVTMGFIYKTDWYNHQSELTLVYSVPQSVLPPLDYEACVTTHAAQDSHANLWMGWLQSPPALKILADYGFNSD